MRALWWHVPSVSAMAAQGRIIRRFSATLSIEWCSVFTVDEKVGTKTIHFNELLRVFLYSKCFGVADLVAPQGLERRMMHLTAGRTLTRRTLAPTTVTDQHGRNHRRRVSSGVNSPNLSASAFRSRMANFLEICVAGFHSCVIDPALLTCAYAGCRPLNDEAFTSKSEVAAQRAEAGWLAPRPSARGGDK
jgi:hypothetical protein